MPRSIVGLITSALGHFSVPLTWPGITKSRHFSYDEAISTHRWQCQREVEVRRDHRLWWSMACFSLCWQYLWSRGPLEQAVAKSHSCMCKLVRFHHFSPALMGIIRLLNMCLLQPVRSNKNPRQLVLEMLAFTVWGAPLERQSPTLLHRYPTFLLLFFGMWHLHVLR